MLPNQTSFAGKIQNLPVSLVSMSDGTLTVCQYILWLQVIVEADSKGRDQTAQMCSLISTFAVHVPSWPFLYGVT